MKEEYKHKNVQLLILAVLSFIIIVVINIVMYNYMPEQMYLNFNGKVSIKKEIFLLIMPILSILLNIFMYGIILIIKREKEKKKKLIDRCIIFNNIGIPFLSIFINLYMQY